MPVTRTGAAQPTFSNMAVENPEGLVLEDYLDLIWKDISGKWTKFAIRHATPLLRESTVTVKTILRRDGNDEEEDYEHTKPVIKSINQPTDWVLPRGRIIFEPDFDGFRHIYHPKRYMPSEISIIVASHARRYRWCLGPDTTLQPYDVVGNHTNGLFTVNNTTTFGEDNRFTIFNYVHEDDTAREHPVKIFYKVDGDWMKLHCVSIPLKLLALLINNYPQ